MTGRRPTKRKSGAKRKHDRSELDEEFSEIDKMVKRESEHLRRTRTRKWLPHPIYTYEVRRKMRPLSDPWFLWYDEMKGKPIPRVREIKCPQCRKSMYYIGNNRYGIALARFHCPDCDESVFKR